MRTAWSHAEPPGAYFACLSDALRIGLHVSDIFALRATSKGCKRMVGDNYVALLSQMLTYFTGRSDPLSGVPDAPVSDLISRAASVITPQWTSISQRVRIAEHWIRELVGQREFVGSLQSLPYIEGSPRECERLPPAADRHASDDLRTGLRLGATVAGSWPLHVASAGSRLNSATEWQPNDIDLFVDVSWLFEADDQDPAHLRSYATRTQFALGCTCDTPLDTMQSRVMAITTAHYGEIDHQKSGAEEPTLRRIQRLISKRMIKHLVLPAGRCLGRESMMHSDKDEHYDKGPAIYHREHAKTEDVSNYIALQKCSMLQTSADMKSAVVKLKADAIDSPAWRHDNSVIKSIHDSIAQLDRTEERERLQSYCIVSCTKLVRSREYFGAFPYCTDAFSPLSPLRNVNIIFVKRCTHLPSCAHSPLASLGRVDAVPPSMNLTASEIMRAFDMKQCQVSASATPNGYLTFTYEDEAARKCVETGTAMINWDAAFCKLVSVSPLLDREPASHVHRIRELNELIEDRFLERLYKYLVERRMPLRVD